ncbi:MAG: hypothetical protein AB1762_16935 [Gemmatimonadota bacterium]
MAGLLLAVMTLSCAKTEDKGQEQQLSVRSAPGSLVGDQDPRTAIEVDAATRAAVMTEMRTMLKGVQGIVIGAVNRDTAAIRAAALKAGMKAASETDPVIQTQLGGDFIQLGMRTHASFDILAADVAKGNQDVMLRRLAVIMGNCVGCHEQWRLTVKQ